MCSRARALQPAAALVLIAAAGCGGGGGERTRLEHIDPKREHALATAIVRLGPGHPWAGDYSSGSGFSCLFLDMAPGAGFSASGQGCLGKWGPIWGEVQEQDGVLRFQCEQDPEFARSFADGLVPVAGDWTTYLVPPSKVEETRRVLERDGGIGAEKCCLVRALNGFTPPIAGPIGFVLPIHADEAAYSAYGIWPYGVHGGGHPEGHPGYDLECTADAVIRAAAYGMIERIEANTTFPGQWDLTISLEGYLEFRYGHLTALSEGVQVGGSVEPGQPLGKPGSVDGFHMIHLAIQGPQLPGHLGQLMESASMAALHEIWQHAAYAEELCEPGLVNATTVEFPLTSTWRRKNGDGPAVLRFTRIDPTTDDYRYEADSEHGAVEVRPRPGQDWSELDLLPVGGAPVRRAVYDIVGPRLRIRWAAERPADLENAWEYALYPAGQG